MLAHSRNEALDRAVKHHDVHKTTTIVVCECHDDDCCFRRDSVSAHGSVAGKEPMLRTRLRPLLVPSAPSLPGLPHRFVIRPNDFDPAERWDNIVSRQEADVVREDMFPKFD